ncbi:MAG: helix-turn-helix domain-containing protein [Hamadaea sp.]|uniref:MarR family transcriptional regulator n=1 Tax=Hamadaea sp. TaxID=2024425 RepID=UPI00180AD910|nr:MarR family transcriptional regulator [Hamadaea sp.]NUR69322.1 helix-turn-helix domain-containing protein [Hamadaea sp.]NUT21974.1 helix-turn-helix domain-containing protein [Hamadaea sp.]
MPGGRLTPEDRRQIAVWLADGLGYAEIGRRLGRPTSTISREVARNGVPADSRSAHYLAEHAQQAAGDRARRRKPSRADPAPGGSTAGREFVEHFAALLAATGLPRMTARVFVALLTADAGLTSADLVRDLRVSPASVSKAIAYLESMQLVVRQPDAGGRRERYAVDDDVWLRAWQADTSAHTEIATATRRGIEIFGAESTAGARLKQMGQFFGRLSEHMGGSTLAEPVVYDALTVLAALMYAARPLTAADLAKALGWPRKRAVAALDAIEQQPAIADPFAVQSTGDVAPAESQYALVARSDRLSPAQQAALADGATARARK